MNFELKLEKRTEKGKSANRKLRREGYLPAVMYGHGEKPQLVKVKRADFDKLFKATKGESVVLQLKLGRSKKLSIIKEVARHPVTGEPLHIDFHILHKGEAVEVAVPVVLVGTPKGIKLCGVLEHILREVTVKAKPSDIPPHVEIDVTELEIGDSIHVKDIKLEGVEILEDPEETIVTILAPRKAVEEVVAPAAEEVEAEAEAEAEEEGEAREAGEEGEK